jgi:hypothetical protein
VHVTNSVCPSVRTLFITNKIGLRVVGDDAEFHNLGPRTTPSGGKENTGRDKTENAVNISLCLQCRSLSTLLGPKQKYHFYHL